uniref:Uncharacterized protein n=1 Tax=Opuntia streptacantha TaxID=393608 RepID=A0A7C9A532_OPUST
MGSRRTLHASCDGRLHCSGVILEKCGPVLLDHQESTSLKRSCPFKLQLVHPRCSYVPNIGSNCPHLISCYHDLASNWPNIHIEAYGVPTYSRFFKYSLEKDCMIMPS